MSRRIVQTHWVCTMCTHYHRMDQPDPRLHVGCGQAQCHSPLLGGSFPAYHGVLRNGEDTMWRWCFLCGADAVAAVRVHLHTMGVCAAHVEKLRREVIRRGGTVRTEADGRLSCATEGPLV